MRLQEKFGRPHPALEGFRDVHPSQSWLVEAYFKLSNFRRFSEQGPLPLALSEMVVMGDSVLRLSGNIRELFLRVMMETESVVYPELCKKTSETIKKATERAGNHARHPNRHRPSHKKH